MIKEIKYGGYTAQPSDYACEDGQLAVSMNLLHEDGELKPLFQPAEVSLGTFSSGEQVVYVHNTAVFKHYILLDSSNHFLWIDAADALHTKHYIGSPYFSFSGTVQKIEAVGNTLCVVCSDSTSGEPAAGIHYLLWKADDTNYKYLGTQPPFVQLSFGLSSNKNGPYERGSVIIAGGTEADITNQAAWRQTSHGSQEYFWNVNSGGFSWNDLTTVPINGSYIDDFNNEVWALINQTNATIAKQGHFYAPFLVRYCYRLYDGTMWMHSAPVFMPVSSPFSYEVEIPTLFYREIDPSSGLPGAGGITWFGSGNVDIKEGNTNQVRMGYLTLRYRPHNVALTSKVISTDELTQLQEDWSDIVKSIDIFVSQPLIREDNSEQIKTVSLATANSKKSYHLNQDSLSQKALSGWKLYAHNGEPVSTRTWTCKVVCDIPLLSEEAYIDKIRSTASFYKVHSYSLETDFDVDEVTITPSVLPYDDPDSGTAKIVPSSDSFIKKKTMYSLRTNYCEVPVDSSVLPVLATQDVMTDDYKSHNKLLPLMDGDKCITSLYNYNGRLNVSGLRERLFSGFGVTGLVPRGSSIRGVADASVQVVKIYTYLHTDDGQRVVLCDTTNQTTITTGTITPEWSYEERLPPVPEDEQPTPYYLYKAIIEDILPDGTASIVISGTTTPIEVIGDEVRFYDTNHVFDSSHNPGDVTYDKVTPVTTLKTLLYNCPLFYPDNRAYRMDILVKDTNTEYYEMYVLKMEAATQLNGASTLGGIIKYPLSTPFDKKDIMDNGALYPYQSVINTKLLPTVSDIVNIPYKVYTSEVNNPFVFPVTGINTVGTGTIMALCSAAKAMSQGQFGQYPLYAFTSEGVWALEVGPTGAYTSVHPVTREICLSVDSITQLDSAVLFATERGIMLLSGSTAACISEPIATEHPFDISQMPKWSELHAIFHNVQTPTDSCLPIQPFQAFLSGCRMIYDYRHQHVIIFNPATHTSNNTTVRTYQYAYVYSLKSMKWGMMLCNIESVVKNYPDALAMNSSGKLVSFNNTTDNTPEYVLLMTRPLKLGDAGILKTIHTVIQRGNLYRTDLFLALWASRDLFHWHIIASNTAGELHNLHGTPYKYFRIAAVGKINGTKTIDGITVEFEPRYTNILH